MLNLFKKKSTKSPPVENPADATPTQPLSAIPLGSSTKAMEDVAIESEKKPSKSKKLTKEEKAFSKQEKKQAKIDAKKNKRKKPPTAPSSEIKKRLIAGVLSVLAISLISSYLIIFEPLSHSSGAKNFDQKKRSLNTQISALKKAVAASPSVADFDASKTITFVEKLIEPYNADFVLTKTGSTKRGVRYEITGEPTAVTFFLYKLSKTSLKIEFPEIVFVYDGKATAKLLFLGGTVGSPIGFKADINPFF